MKFNSQSFLEKHRNYFWDFGDLKKISEEKVVERTLNFGSLKSIRELICILGKERVARIFFTQISQKRDNYQVKIKNYFQIIFREYA